VSSKHPFSEEELPQRKEQLSSASLLWAIIFTVLLVIGCSIHLKPSQVPKK